MRKDHVRVDQLQMKRILQQSGQLMSEAKVESYFRKTVESMISDCYQIEEARAVDRATFVIL